MSGKFRCVGLIGKFGDPGSAPTLHALAEYLQARDVEVLLDEGNAADLSNAKLTTVSREELGKRCDLAIVVGGDGTLLNAARSLADAGVPVLGVNRGRLGFLVDVSPDEMTERLDEVFAGKFIEENRALLHAYVKRGGQKLSECDALNDVVVHKLDIARMIELEVSINGKFLNRHRSDGLVVSTTTGSTAYALSGGGPILHPNLDAIVMVPICPHTLSYRPIVIHDESEIRIEVCNGSHTQAQITFDGQVNFGLTAGDVIQIHKKDRALRLIHPPQYDYFEILRAKLHWSSQP